MLPNFLVIGAMKAGTDSLYQYLRHHPRVFMSETKELDFFTKELNWHMGRQWYESQFDAPEGSVAIGEASTSYAKFPLHSGVPERISGMLPDVALMYLVRHPIERLCSQYIHQALHMFDRRPIDQAVLEDSSYVDFSRYAMQIEQYLEYFPREQLLVVKSEDLRDNRKATIERVLKFISVDGTTPQDVLAQEFHRTAEKRVLRSFFHAVHRMPGYARVASLVPASVKERTLKFRTRGIDPLRGRLSHRVQRILEDQLKDDIARLRHYMDDDFDGWGII